MTNSFIPAIPLTIRPFSTATHAKTTDIPCTVPDQMEPYCTDVLVADLVSKGPPSPLSRQANHPGTHSADHKMPHDRVVGGQCHPEEPYHAPTTAYHGYIHLDIAYWLQPSSPPWVPCKLFMYVRQAYFEYHIHSCMYYTHEN